MTALEVLQKLNVPEALYVGKTEADHRKLARALDPNWKAPPGPMVEVEIVSYTPTSGKKGVGQFLRLSTGGRSGLFERVCDGDTLTSEGKATAQAILIEIANRAADLAESLG